ncbi:hypothetical protein B0H13DRAFT_2386424 [Mycena leptocephala]|nr:hypothetical protein B0H13DRAFT_2386424 [Mycena leptocephala]
MNTIRYKYDKASVHLDTATDHVNAMGGAPIQAISIPALTALGQIISIVTDTLTTVFRVAQTIPALVATVLPLVITAAVVGLTLTVLVASVTALLATATALLSNLLGGALNCITGGLIGLL